MCVGTLDGLLGVDFEGRSIRGTVRIFCRHLSFVTIAFIATGRILLKCESAAVASDASP